MDSLAADTRAQTDATPEKAARRWLLELKLAKKREKDWRDLGKQIIEKYRGTKRKKNSFNILWANTETLRPALYNSPPKPDVRRRFRQNDMLGKAVAEVSERSISYCVDAYDLDNCIKGDVLDALLPGRGISRVRYVPKINQVVGEQPEVSEEELEYEQALCEHVQWDDYLQGPGKTWEEVCWVGFKHRLTKDDIVEKFGDEIAKEVRLDSTDDDDVNSQGNKDIAEVFKRAEFWEIWDKDGKKVFFVNESYKKGLIYPKTEEGETAAEGEPPLKLKHFFPCPNPLKMVEDTGTQIPIPLYELYREQAEELDRISTRINKVVNACRVRGVYDSTLSELSALMKGDDNDLIAVEQARAWMANGGIEKAIWWMPVQQAAVVLKELYVARDACKQVIYEITGLSDILRGATDPNETLGAQQLKANSASMRLQRMQREVQRYVRDLIRLLAEVIGENFDPQTLQQMTGLQFPQAIEKQTLQIQAQALSAQNQPITKEMQDKLMLPSWDEVMGVLRSDMQREFRVDVETDSTVAQTLQQDMEGLREVITSIVEFWTGVGPAVQSGAVSIDAVKAITMSVVRRARMGLEVEDALESGMQQPKPQQESEGDKIKAEAEKSKAQADISKTQLDGQMAQRKAQAEERKMQMEAEIAEREHAMKMEELSLTHQARMAELQMKAAMPQPQPQRPN